MKTFTKVMKALSDPNRVKIIKLLQRRMMCVCELQCALGISQPNVSKHLRILEEVGMIQSSKDGLWVNYSLSTGKMNPYAASMLGNLWHWLDDDPEIYDVVQGATSIDRQNICPRN